MILGGKITINYQTTNVCIVRNGSYTTTNKWVQKVKKIDYHQHLTKKNKEIIINICIELIRSCWCLLEVL